MGKSKQELKAIRKGRRPKGYIADDTYKPQADGFLKAIEEKYIDYRDYWMSKGFTEDQYQNTLLNCYKSILNNGIGDTSQKGYLDYFFKACRFNRLTRQGIDRKIRDDEKALARLDDVDANSDEMKKQLFEDYQIIHIMNRIEKEPIFTDEEKYLFKVKWMYDIPYTKLAKRTGIEGARNKVLHVMFWLRLHLTKEELLDGFDKWYEANKKFYEN